MRYFKFLFSGSFMAILLLVFAVAVGYATFIENDFDPVTARALVYNTQWFELILLLMVINFAGMIFTRKLYLKSQLNILAIHLALIIIIAGAAITRFTGYEGQMRIREGQSTNRFVSSETFFDLTLKRNGDSVRYLREVLLSQKGGDILNKDFSLGSNTINVRMEEYYPNGSEVLVRTDDGSPYINVIVGSSDGRHDLYLREGSSEMVHDLGISFGDTTQTNFIQVIENEGKLFMRLPLSAVKASVFNDNKIPTNFFPVELMSVHTIMNSSFVIKEFFESAEMRYARAENKNQEGTRVARINIDGNTIFPIFGKEQIITINDIEAKIYVGNKMKELPFFIRLNQFRLERYPGSNSPSSYASDVTVIDEASNSTFDHEIYMNNILNYGGYRFFQTSYDQDEKGTILTVNHDYWGTVVTYIGYFLLMATLLLSFFTSKTRFRRILHQIKETHTLRKNATRATALLITVIATTIGNAQPSITAESAVDKEHAAEFGALMIHDREGRIVPINTMANKYLVKIHKKDEYKGLTADQFFLDILINAGQWQHEPLVKITDPSIQSILGISDEYAKFSDFLDEKNFYKLKQSVEQAYAKQPSTRNTFDKEVMNVDERANILYMLLNGAYLHIFPLPNDPANRWVSPSDYHNTVGHDNPEAQLFNDYLQKLIEAKSTGNYTVVKTLLDEFKAYQRKAGGDIVPPESKINMEISYNRMEIFKRLFPFYLTLGILMIAIFFLQTFNPKLEFAILRKILAWILLVAFLIHTYGLGLRWYISGHEPWSNGYESMIYISWAIVLAGFIFMRASYATLGVTAILSGITLLTAHMSWMNPEITNLVPVLKSYWLTIHVATITASYGFLGLGCMMGFLNLCIMIFRNAQNQMRINLALKELTLIVELSMAVGLVLLVIGNFLGAIWANESWGRYWGWDPKESWTLVSVIVYSLILHLNLVPSVRNAFTFNLFAILGFATILMTYFGVNFYLSGLHSYAGGDAVPIPAFVYYTLAVIAIVSLLAAWNQTKLKAAGNVLNGT